MRLGLILPGLSPPNVSIGGPVRFSPGFPLKPCGNDDANKAHQLPLRNLGEIEIKLMAATGAVNYVPGLFRKLCYRFVPLLLPLTLGEDKGEGDFCYCPHPPLSRDGRG